MAEKLKLELITPYKIILNEEVDEITATGSEGEFGLLPGHAPFLSALKIGELTYKQHGVFYNLALNWGYVEVKDDDVTVLVQTAEKADEIDVDRAKSALDRAEDALKKLTSEDKQFKVYEAALQRAIIRLQVAGKSVRK